MRVTGRILGLCLAAVWASDAVCANLAPSGGLSRATSILDSDAVATGLVQSRPERMADEPVTDAKACPGLTAVSLRPISSNLHLAADLQAPPLTSLGTGPIRDSLGEDMHPARARAAVLDSSDKAAGSAMAGASAANQVVSLKVRALSDQERSNYGLAGGGLVVTAVDPSAAREGFRTGDVVLMLDGVSLVSASQFYKLLHQLPADRPVPVLVHRSTIDLFLPLGTPRR